MNTYKAYYKDREMVVEATSSYKAQRKAAIILKVRKAYEVTIVLIAVDGKPVTPNPQQ